MSLILCGALAGSVQAQTPVAEIENSDGEEVFISFEDGGLLGLGEEGTGTIPVEGEGTRLMWYPGKAAFRAGFAFESRWNDANIGDNSVAFGSGTTASGNRTTAMGQSTTASGFASTVMGLNTTASARSSTAMGEETTASGWGSTAMGNETTASGDFSTAMGNRTVAATDGSLSIGRLNDANTTDDGTLFVVGNGIGTPGTPSDALVLDFLGNLTIAGEASATAFNTTSDRRLKTGITPLEDRVLGKLSGIRPVYYRFKEGTGHSAAPQLGLIAQDVQAHFPELVSEGNDGYLSLSYSNFTAVLLKGLQEQQTTIQEQQTQISQLQKKANRMAELEARLNRMEHENHQQAELPMTALLFLFAICIVGGAVWKASDHRGQRHRLEPEPRMRTNR